MSLPRSFVALQNETFLPFLYCTRTLTAPVNRSRFYISLHNLRPAHRCPFSTSRSLKSNDISSDQTRSQNRSESDPEDDTSEISSDYLKLRSSRSISVRASRKPTKPETPKKKLQSTITPAERDAFERLYKRLDEDKDSTEKTAAKVESHQSSQKTEELSKSESFDPDLKRAISYTQEQTTSTTEVASQSQRFQEAQEAPKQHRIEAGPPGTYAIASQTALLESRKICSEMDQAAASGDGDLGVWRVCEKRVFPMIDLINLPKSLSSATTRRRRRQSISRERRRKGELGSLDSNPEDLKSASADISKASILDIPSDVPVLPVVSKVYPDVILHAQQLFQDKFPMSPFTTQLFEAVKARGRTSLMMAASVDLCNELIGFRWRVYNDLPYIVALLKEMEEGGVEFNRHTLALVEGIQQERTSALNEDGGGNSNPNSWWESDAIRTAYQQLVGETSADNGWISRVKSHIGTETDLREQRKIMWANAQQ